MLWWLAAALAWLAGIAWQLGEARLWPMAAYVVATLIAALVLLGVCWAHARQGPTLVLRWRCVAMVAVATLAWGSTGWRAGVRLAERLPSQLVGQDLDVRVQIEGLVKPTLDGWAFDARLLHGPAGVPEHLALRMRAAGLGAAQPALMAGQSWRMQVRLHEPDGLHNPGGFDATLGAFERGVRAVGTVRVRPQVPTLVSAQPEWPWQGAVDRLRQRIRARVMAEVTDTRAAGILSGLAVGDQSAIDPRDWDVFRRTGVAHLVSISGTHIAMMGWLLSGCVRRVWARWPRAVHRVPAPLLGLWVAVVGAALYALLAGWGVPAQRTVWMMATVALLRSQGRRWPMSLVWLCTALPVTMLDPWAMRQAGFWLSYVAVGILLASGGNVEQGLVAGRSTGQDKAAAPNEKPAKTPTRFRLWADGLAPSLRTWFWASARTQLVVILALSPVAMVCFQQVSVVGFGANVLAVPVFSLGITPLALLGVVWSGFWQLGAWLIGYTVADLAQASQWSWAVWQTPALPAWVAAVAVLGGLLLVLCQSWSWRLMTLPLFAPLLHLPPSWHLLPPPHAGQFEVLSADVGQGTAVLVRTSAHSLLFDTGGRVGSGSDSGTRTLLPLFQAMGVRQLDTLVISHQDTDHVGGAAAIVAGMPVKALVSSLSVDHPLRLQAGATGQPLPHQPCVAGMLWDWDGVRFEVLHPTQADLAQREHLPPNALSCVLRVSRVNGLGGLGGADQASAQREASALLTGDIEAAQEQALLTRLADRPQALSSTLLLAPHHGSQTSSTEAFLRAVAPADVVVQVGRRNRYGHPSPQVLARYQALGLPVHASPDCGAHIWSSQTTAGTCWRQTSRHPWDDVFIEP